MSWTCMSCQHENDRDVPLFGDEAVCEKCGAIHGTDWDYVTEDSLASWIVCLSKAKPSQGDGNE